MTCTQCQREIPDEAAFCLFCGRRQRSVRATIFPKPLRRSRVDQPARRHLRRHRAVPRHRSGLHPGGVDHPVRRAGHHPARGARLRRGLDHRAGSGAGNGADRRGGQTAAAFLRTTSPWPACAAALRSTSRSTSRRCACCGSCSRSSRAFVIFGIFAYAAAWFIMPEPTVIPAAATPPKPPPAPATDTEPATTSE